MIVDGLLGRLLEKPSIILDDLKGVEVLLGREVSFSVPAVYVERENNKGKDVKKDSLMSGRFVRLKGYKGKFRIEISTESWRGYHHAWATRENIPEDYKGKIIRIKDFER